jgi:hypothetical protein
LFRLPSDVSHLPTTDGRTVVLARYTEPEPDHAALLQQMNLHLPTATAPIAAANVVAAG